MYSQIGMLRVTIFKYSLHKFDETIQTILYFLSFYAFVRHRIQELQISKKSQVFWPTLYIRANEFNC